MKKSSIILPLLILISASLLQAQGGFYLGGSVGSSFVETKVGELEEQDLKIDKNNFAYKIFGGLRLSEFLSAEGGYRNTGKAKTDIENVTLSTTTYGWDVAAVGKLDILLITAFAKAGAFFWKTKIELIEEAPEDNGTAFLWGFGAGINLGSIDFRVEWENMEVEETENLSMLTAGITFGF
jgi:hypothetical protein